MITRYPIFNTVQSFILVSVEQCKCVCIGNGTFQHIADAWYCVHVGGGVLGGGGGRGSRISSVLEVYKLYRRKILCEFLCEFHINFVQILYKFR